MFKSKHSGWTWELKRTPFGGGGGFNPIAAITDPISSALGTDGGGGGVLGGLAAIDPGPALGETLASVDPGPAIGSGLAQADEFVNREIPGGWVLPAALAVAYATGYIDPSLFATEAAAAAGAEAGAGAIATEAGQTAFFNALAAGASSTEAVSAGLAADAALTGVGAGIADVVTSTPGADSILGSSTNIANLTPPSAGNFGSITAPLTGSGAIPGAGAITNAGGLTGAMPAGIMVGDGTLGTTIGQTYMAAAPGQFALDAAGAAIPAGASGIAGTVPSGTSLSTSGLTEAEKLAKALASQAGSQANNAAQQLSSNYGRELSGIIRGNQNPFVQGQQFEVQSKKPDLTQLAKLLKQVA